MRRVWWIYLPCCWISHRCSSSIYTYQSTVTSCWCCCARWTSASTWIAWHIYCGLQNQSLLYLLTNQHLTHFSHGFSVLYTHLSLVSWLTTTGVTTWVFDGFIFGFAGGHIFNLMSLILTPAFMSFTMSLTVSLFGSNWYCLISVLDLANCGRVIQQSHVFLLPPQPHQDRQHILHLAITSTLIKLYRQHIGSQRPSFISP